MSANISVDGPFAEVVTYKPRVGSEREIHAIVNRFPPARPLELDRGQVPTFEIIVNNNEVDGISATELNIGGDRINVAQMIGGTAEDILLPKPENQDTATLTFRIGKK